MKKIVSIILLIIILVSFCTIAKANTLGSMISGADEFIGKANAETIDTGRLRDMSSTLYRVLLVLAIIFSLIVGALIGIKLVTNGAEGKADMKQAFVPYIIGNVVVFGAFGIWKLVVNILNSIA